MRSFLPLRKCLRTRLIGMGAVLACCGCLIQATTSTTLVGVTVKATFPGAGSVAQPAPVTYDPAEGPPDEESVTYSTHNKALKVTVRLTDPDDPKSPRQLLINDKDYGTVTTADEVHVQGDGVAVKVNGTVRSPK